VINKILTLTPAQEHIFFSSEKFGRFRFFPKGRRLGATHGAAIAHIKWMLDGDTCLWGDTINSNIDRYVERYFKPFLRAYKIPFSWNVQKKLMKVGYGYTDFRSADNPENWEGFGYNRIFLNEAGIILNDEYLYYNSVLPMMLDEPDSQLIAAGTPKLLRSKGRLFYDLYKKAIDREPGYYTKTFSTYDNIFLKKEQIKELEMKIPANERQQEIYGKMMLESGSIVNLSWFQRYKALPEYPSKIIISLDTASKDKQINDPTVMSVWYEFNNVFYLVDILREWLKYPELKRTTKSYCLKWNPNVVLVEDKSSGMALIQDLNVDRDFRWNIIPITPVIDKVTRMSTASLNIEAGRVYLPESAPWLPVYETEITTFPNCKNDDQCDSTSQFLNWIKKPTEIFIG